MKLITHLAFLFLLAGCAPQKVSQRTDANFKLAIKHALLKPSKPQPDKSIEITHLNGSGSGTKSARSEYQIKVHGIAPGTPLLLDVPYGGLAESYSMRVVTDEYGNLLPARTSADNNGTGTSASSTPITLRVDASKGARTFIFLINENPADKYMLTASITPQPEILQLPEGAQIAFSKLEKQGNIYLLEFSGFKPQESFSIRIDERKEYFIMRCKADDRGCYSRFYIAFSPKQRSGDSRVVIKREGKEFQTILPWSNYGWTSKDFLSFMQFIQLVPLAEANDCRVLDF